MAGFLIVGEEPSTFDRTVGIMKKSKSFDRLHLIWQNVADMLGVLDKVKRKNKLEDTLNDMLFYWNEKYASTATLDMLCFLLETYNAKPVSDVLKAEFTRILKEHILGPDGVFLPCNPIPMSSLFKLPSVMANDHRKNDPLLLSDCLRISKSTMSKEIMCGAVEKLIKKLDEQQLKILEQYSFKKLSLVDLAWTLKIHFDRDEDKARRIMQNFNLTNFGQSYVFWYVVAQAILNYRSNNPWKMKQIFYKVFAIELEDATSLPRFNYEMLIFFMDWLVGTGLTLDIKIDNENWLTNFSIACNKYNATHLVSKISTIPEILHSLVKDSMWLDGSRLEARKSLISKIIEENQKSVNNRDANNCPPLLLTYIHVELLRILIRVPHIDMHVVDYQGRNFAQLAARYLRGDQFSKLVRYLTELQLTNLLHA